MVSERRLAYFSNFFAMLQVNFEHLHTSSARTCRALTQLLHTYHTSTAAKRCRLHGSCALLLALFVCKRLLPYAISLTPCFCSALTLHKKVYFLPLVLTFAVALNARKWLELATATTFAPPTLSCKLRLVPLVCQCK